eukprot:CAMPEP_0198506338 /NCGR_PEP_ID=MMETSP1462-20131121/11625_1 /TAXON_ID=1333877 /ORGANISM="Brandtodinium nutriculum, Strain RCC3387" /LENGTH=185 /DNA_ID=CAMNT_0044235555 /DNA_START=29 /DNA_END=584 /DNA_ORIENTATION=+
MPLRDVVAGARTAVRPQLDHAHWRGGLEVPSVDDVQAHLGSLAPWAELGRLRLHGYMETEEFGRDQGRGALVEWFRDLREQQVPRILEDLQVIANIDAFAAGRWVAPPSVGGTRDCPAPYREVLRLLRALVEERRWPATSAAREQVVRAGDGGTFSVGRVEVLGQRAPKWSAVFPELTAALFALE